MNEWKKLSECKLIPSYRTGWIGVFDALKSAITREPRITFDQNYTFSVWVKSECEAKISLTSSSFKADNNE